MRLVRAAYVSDFWFESSFIVYLNLTRSLVKSVELRGKLTLPRVWSFLANFCVFGF